VALTVRVVDLDDHRLELAAPVPAQEEAGRVERIAEHPQVGHQRDLPAARVKPRQQVVGMVARTSRAGGSKWSSSRKDQQRVPASAADRPQPARHLVELVDIERDVEDAMSSA
jgi:hypothetical protein